MNNHYSRRRNKIAYINCNTCNTQIPNGRKRRCNRCQNEYINERRINRNNNDGDNELDRMRNYVQSVANSYSTGINKRNDHMKNQGYVDVKNILIAYESYL